MNKNWRGGVVKQPQNHAMNVRIVVCCCEGHDANPLRMGGTWRSKFGLLLYPKHL